MDWKKERKFDEKWSGVLHFVELSSNESEEKRREESRKGEEDLTQK